MKMQGNFEQESQEVRREAEGVWSPTFFFLSTRHKSKAYNSIPSSALKCSWQTDIKLMSIATKQFDCCIKTAE